MNEPDQTSQANPAESADPQEHTPAYPPGDHPLEVAARRGFGPLSPRAGQHWHGDGRPCVTCGQLVLRNAAICEYCEQDLRPEMIEKMKVHAGPWYVLEHVRPFPGVTLELIVRQIRRGLITEASIVRGPSTHYQWKFARETPGLCLYFGRCWSCHEPVSITDTHCAQCLSNLVVEQPPLLAEKIPAPQAPAAPSTAKEKSPEPPPDATAAETPAPARPATSRPAPNTPVTRKVPVGGKEPPAKASRELANLSAVVSSAQLPSKEPIWEDPPKVAGISATLIAAGAILIMIVGMIAFF